MCRAVNQLVDGELHERDASTDFGEILIYLELYNVKLFIYICETGDFEKESKSLLLNCSRRLTVDLNSYTGLSVEITIL